MPLLNFVNWDFSINVSDVLSPIFLKAVLSFPNITTIKCSGAECLMETMKTDAGSLYVSNRDHFTEEQHQEIARLGTNFFWMPEKVTANTEADLMEKLRGYVKWKVLVVDDNQVYADQVADFLRINGHKVKQVYSGREAVRIVKDTWKSQDRIDLLITDQQIGEERAFWGSEIIQRIKDRIHPDIKSILMSSEPVETHSADTFLLKEFALEELRDQVRNIC